MGDVITYSIAQANGLSVGSWVNLNPTSGALIMTGGYANVGWNYFEVTGTDKAGSFLTQPFGILINSPPIINETMGTLYATQEIPFAAKLSQTLFIDPDQ